MRVTLFQFLAGLGFGVIATAADDSGGLTATLAPAEARPGDLVTLQVTMNREDYGEFALDFPAHPRLRLVSRERIPPRITEGRYLQGERLVLQAVSSGPLVIAGMTARLTEAAGARVVNLPEARLTVLPFDSSDENSAPEPFPAPEVRKRGSFPLAIGAAGVLGGSLLLALFLRARPRREAAG